MTGWVSPVPGCGCRLFFSRIPFKPIFCSGCCASGCGRGCGCDCCGGFRCACRCDCGRAYGSILVAYEYAPSPPLKSTPQTAVMGQLGCGCRQFFSRIPQKACSLFSFASCGCRLFFSGIPEILTLIFKLQWLISANFGEFRFERNVKKKKR